jgi:hypothetical protein
MALPESVYNVDWVFSTATNAHIAKHREWFTSYTPFPTEVESVLGDAVAAHGVGKVALECVIPSDTESSGEKSKKITLHNVLYIPTYPCNILGIGSEDHFAATIGPHGGMLREKGAGPVCGLLDKVVLWKLRLKGQPAGMTSLDRNANYMVSSTWPEEEEKRWKAYQQSQAVVSRPQGAAYNVDWVFSSASNVHVATHKDWFKTFSAFDSHLVAPSAGPGWTVEGFGDVELQVRTSTTDSQMLNKLVLKDVLYVPTYQCNVLGGEMLHNNTCHWGSHEYKFEDSSTGAPIAILQAPPIVALPKLWLKDQPAGTTSLYPQRSYWINATWIDSERARFESFKRDQAVGGAAATETDRMV